MMKVILKKKGYPITKEILRVQEMLFTKRDDKDWLYNVINVIQIKEIIEK